MYPFKAGSLDIRAKQKHPPILKEGVGTSAVVQGTEEGGGGEMVEV